MPSITVNGLDVAAEAEWRFRDSKPHWRHQLHGAAAAFDPFPAYPHNLDDVRGAAAHVERMCPPLWDVEVYVADREEEGRSNGFSNIHEGSRYVGGEWVKSPPTGLIMLSGKRVPPHPSVTRYLVAHEYGHNVEWMLQHARGHKTVHGDEVVAEYAKMRGLPAGAVHHGSGGRWHDSATEILACDFRIVVCDVEPQYWPHPGVAHPLDVNVDGWWAEALALLEENRTATPDVAQAEG